MVSTVQYGIQRRAIYLVPPEGDDASWMLDIFDRDEEVWGMFGFAEPAKKEMERRLGTGRLVVGIAHRVEGRARFGFTVCFPPTDHLGIWEFGVVIPDPRERDAFSAISASDATAHYMFDHLRVENGQWRIRADNTPSLAIARRMGYRPFGTWSVNGHRYRFFRINETIWAKRREKLDRGEVSQPSGLGASFLTLEGPPYDPEDVT